MTVFTDARRLLSAVEHQSLSLTPSGQRAYDNSGGAFPLLATVIIPTTIKTVGYRVKPFLQMLRSQINQSTK